MRSPSGCSADGAPWRPPPCMAARPLRWGHGRQSDAEADERRSGGSSGPRRGDGVVDGEERASIRPNGPGGAGLQSLRRRPSRVLLPLRHVTTGTRASRDSDGATSRWCRQPYRRLDLIAPPLAGPVPEHTTQATRGVWGVLPTTWLVTCAPAMAWVPPCRSNPHACRSSHLKLTTMVSSKRAARCSRCNSPGRDGGAGATSQQVEVQWCICSCDSRANTEW